MAAIHQYQETQQQFLFDADKQENVRQSIAAFFWAWFMMNQEKGVIPISLFKVVKFTVRVKHLRPLFVELFGEPLS